VGVEEADRAAAAASFVPVILRGQADPSRDGQYIVMHADTDDFQKALIDAMMAPIEDSRPCPYGPPGGLHSPACVCNLSPSTRTAVLWDALVDDPNQVRAGTPHPPQSMGGHSRGLAP